MNIPNLPTIDFFNKFLTDDIASIYLNRLSKEIEFNSETYTFNNQIITTKRKIAFHSDKSYSYSNQVYSGKPWNPVLIELKEMVEKITGLEFNAVLCNHYENGEAGMGWHADKEKELGMNPNIASLSFGETRRFAFRHRTDVVNLKNPPRLIEYPLKSGDLLVMKGETQKYFEHSVIKDKSCKGLRINLTFRNIVN